MLVYLKFSLCLCYWYVLKFIGVSLSKPHINCDNGPSALNNGMSACIIYPVFVPPWFPRSMHTLKYSVYSCILTCSHAWFKTACTRRTIGATQVFRKNYRRRQVGECTDTWYKQIHSTETVDCGAATTLQLADAAPVLIRNDWWIDCTAVLHPCESGTTNGLTVLLFCDVHIDIDMTLNCL